MVLVLLFCQHEILPEDISFCTLYLCMYLYVFAIFVRCVLGRVEDSMFSCINSAYQLSSIGVIEVCLLSCYQISWLPDHCLLLWSPWISWIVQVSWTDQVWSATFSDMHFGFLRLTVINLEKYFLTCYLYNCCFQLIAGLVLLFEFCGLSELRKMRALPPW